MKKENGEPTIKEYLTVFVLLYMLYKVVLFSLTGDTPVLDTIVAVATIGEVLLIADYLTRYNKLRGAREGVLCVSVPDCLIMLGYAVPTIIFCTSQGQVHQFWFWGTIAMDVMIFPIIAEISRIKARGTDKNSMVDQPIIL